MTKDRTATSSWRNGDTAHFSLMVPQVPAIIDPNDPQGLVLTGTQLDDLVVLIPLWPSYAGRDEWDTVTLFWSGAASGDPVATQRFDGPVDTALFPFAMAVDKNLLQPDGVYELWYVVTGSNNTSVSSERRTVTIDTRPPSYNQQLLALLLPADLPGGVIDEAYLANHNDEVELRLPSPVYLDAEAGDTVDLYWSQDNPPTSDVVASKTVTQAEIGAGDIRIVLPGSVIRAPDRDGDFYATYKVRDRAGNETQTFSRETAATVTLKPLPGAICLSLGSRMPRSTVISIVRTSPGTASG